MSIPGFSFAQQNNYWRSMRLLNFYRLIIASILIGFYFFLDTNAWWSQNNGSLYLRLAVGYLLVSFVAIAFTWIKWPKFNRLLTLQTCADIAFIAVLMHAAGGIKSGLGLLLVVAIAAASLISQGRLALFYAALASISLLLEQSYQLLIGNDEYSDYSHAVMLSLSCFATAWLAYSFGKRTLKSEELASQRGIDLQNLAQVNELITQEMQDGVLVVDKDFKLRHHNTQAEGLLGTSKPLWDARNLDECAPQLAALMRRWIQEGGEIGPGAMKLATEERELRLRFMPVGMDRRQGAVIFIEDWSQMQVQAQQLKLAALGRLTGNIAHEIRNPLSAISHANQLMQEEVHDSSSQHLLQIVADNVERLDQMVKDVLELNRRDRTRQEIIVLEEFLKEFHEQFCQTEKILPVCFGLEMGRSTTRISFDRRHLNQILWNVCRNGWRHSKQKVGSLTLSMRASLNSRSIRLEIADDGPGVSAEDRAHLFEPFFTTESTGTGLGLYIARELCEANDATIQYVAPDKGSLFLIHPKKVPI
jgi:two-component system sensor histidine kinase PilS (NtrC family)